MCAEKVERLSPMLLLVADVGEHRVEEVDARAGASAGT